MEIHPSDPLPLERLAEVLLAQLRRGPRTFAELRAADLGETEVK
jgi:hypothetical protein